MPYILYAYAYSRPTVDRYLSYISYEQYKEENPDKF